MRCQTALFVCLLSYAVTAFQPIGVMRTIHRRQHSSLHVESSNSAKSTSIFDRVHESEHLDALLGQSPTSITVVLGPRSCGKSAFLRDYVQQRELGNSICYIDCRMFDVTTPDRFAVVLVQQGLPALIKYLSWEHWEDVKKPFVAVADMFNLRVCADLKSDLTVQFAEFLEQVVLGKQTLPDLPTILQTYGILLECWEKARMEKKCTDLQWPVLIIDEANVLQAWSNPKPEYSKSHERDLETLLRFFVGNTKDRKQCHIVLVSSDYGLQGWLDTRIGDGFYNTVVIGDFQEAHARKFFTQQHKVPSITDDEWSEVFDVCGGNAGNLHSAIMEYNMPTTKGNWTSALERVSARITARVEDAAYNHDGWTAAQFADAALLLLDSSNNAVTKKQMEMHLGRHLIDDTDEQQVIGKATLEALVKANRLSLRPSSNWALDIPYGRFPSGAVIVTAPSAVDLHAMKNMRSQFEQTVQKWNMRKHWEKFVSEYY